MSNTFLKNAAKIQYNDKICIYYKCILTQFFIIESGIYIHYCGKISYVKWVIDQVISRLSSATNPDIF